MLEKCPKCGCDFITLYDNYSIGFMDNLNLSNCKMSAECGDECGQKFTYHMKTDEITLRAEFYGDTNEGVNNVKR